MAVTLTLTPVDGITHAPKSVFGYGDPWAIKAVLAWDVLPMFNAFRRWFVVEIQFSLTLTRTNNCCGPHRCEYPDFCSICNFGGVESMSWGGPCNPPLSVSNTANGMTFYPSGGTFVDGSDFFATIPGCIACDRCTGFVQTVVIYTSVTPPITTSLTYQPPGPGCTVVDAPAFHGTVCCSGGTPTTPTISTLANPGNQFPGLPVSDRVTLSGVTPGATGTITADLYQGDCSAAPVRTATASVAGPGVYNVGPVTAPSTPGAHYWRARYSGDMNNVAAGPNACGETAERLNILSTTSWRDVLTRFKLLTGLSFRDARTRFHLRTPGSFRDVQTRFKLQGEPAVGERTRVMWTAM